MIDRVFLEKLRSIIIQLLNALDDALGYERTIPPRHNRRQYKRNALTLHE